MHIVRPKKAGSLYCCSRTRMSVSSPCIHNCRTASIHSGFSTITSFRSRATNLYFGESVAPTRRWVTSEVRSGLSAAPISFAKLASCVYMRIRRQSSPKMNWRVSRHTRCSNETEVKHITAPMSGCSLSMARPVRSPYAISTQ